LPGEVLRTGSILPGGKLVQFFCQRVHLLPQQLDLSRLVVCGKCLRERFLRRPPLPAARKMIGAAARSELRLFFNVVSI